MTAPTVGAKFATKRLHDHQFKIWDTAGDLLIREMIPLYIQSSGVAILCYDVTSRASFAALSSSVTALGTLKDHTMLAVVGTKCDLVEQREVPRRESNAFAAKHAALYYETSAKAGYNVDELFVDIAERQARQNPGSCRPPGLGTPSQSMQSAAAIRNEQGCLSACKNPEIELCAVM